MNWKLHTHKHYSAEHTHNMDKARLAAESLIQRDKLPKKEGIKRHPRQRT